MSTSTRTTTWRHQRLAESRLYVCTDLQHFITPASEESSPEKLDTEAARAFFATCYEAGVDIIQVRDKTVATRVELQALHILVEEAHRAGALAATNDRADLAVLAHTDVFHVGQRDLLTADARAIVGPDVIIGRSCNTRSRVNEAAADPDIDYFCTGPIWKTPTKPQRKPVGLGLPRYAAELIGKERKPFFAIGGVNTETLPDVKESGATRIVVVRAITAAPDPAQATRDLRAALA